MEVLNYFEGKFPELHKLLPKIKKDKPFSPSNFIWVKNQYAIVYNDGYAVFFDLNRYFSDKLNIEENQTDALEAVLNFLEGKYLSFEFWEQLTKGGQIHFKNDIENDYISINNGSVIIDLSYIDPEVSYREERIETLKKICSYPLKSMSMLSINFSFFNSLKSALNSIVGSDDINVRFCGLDKPLQFTFQNNSFIFGIVINEYDNCDQMFVFYELENFVKGL